MSVAQKPTPDKVVVLDFHQRIPIAYCKKSSTFDLHVGADVHHVDIEGMRDFLETIQPNKRDFGWQERDGATGKPCGWYLPHGEGAYNWAYDRWYEAREELMRL
jgi:hypothetical protein